MIKLSIVGSLMPYNSHIGRESRGLAHGAHSPLFAPNSLKSHLNWSTYASQPTNQARYPPFSNPGSAPDAGAAKSPHSDLRDAVVGDLSDIYELQIKAPLLSGGSRVNCWQTAQR